MKNVKKRVFMGVMAVFIIILIIAIYQTVLKIKRDNEMENNFDSEIAEFPRDEIDNEKKEEQVEGYHLVTYSQNANTNSFLKTLDVTSQNDGKIKFVIGKIVDDSVVKERMNLELDCKKGENHFELLEKKYFVKKDEYLMMDISKENVLYTQNSSTGKSLVQTEENKKDGKMLMTKSDYILPFSYTLDKVIKYNALVIGNDITTKNGSIGLLATDESHDYYALTKKRLESSFEKVNINRINADEWEKSADKQSWINNNLLDDKIKNLDLVIFQLGDNYKEANMEIFENDVKTMLEWIRKVSPNAELVWIGPWNENKNMQNQLPEICKKFNMEYININDLNVSDYQSLYEETDEYANTIQTYYPNNEAMQIISNRIIETLEFDF